MVPHYVSFFRKVLPVASEERKGVLGSEEGVENANGYYCLRTCPEQVDCQQSQ
jgi:hypothetical protein